MKKKCGEPTDAGHPCGRPAGAGTDHKGTGPCWGHDQERKNESTKAEKKKILEALGVGSTLGEACDEAGYSEPQVWRWRQQDPEFGEQVDALLDAQPATQLRRVEASLFERVLKGEAGQTLTIFWLVNQAAKVARQTGEHTRWEHVYNIKADVTHGVKVPIGALAEAHAALEEGEAVGFLAAFAAGTLPDERFQIPGTSSPGRNGRRNGKGSDG